MSYFDTARVIVVIRYTLIFAFVLNSEAFANGKCERFFKPTLAESFKTGLAYLNPLQILSRKSKPELSVAQAGELKAFLSSDLNVKPYGMGRGTEHPLFIYIWNRLPESEKSALIYLFQNSSKEFKKLRMSVSDLLSQHEIEVGYGSTYIELLLSNWADYLNHNPTSLSFADWILQLQQKYDQRLNSGEIKLQDLKLKFEEGVSFRNAGHHWQQQLGVHELPMRSENGQNSVLVNGRWLKTQIDRNKKTIRILAPREMVGRAAWNPIYTEVLKAKIASGQRKLAQYPAFLATNGIFYLSDGNHRYILDDRSEVWLEMSYPVRTASMSNSFDAIGLAQPSIEKLVSLQNGEITLEDLIGPANAAKIIYR